MPPVFDEFTRCLNKESSISSRNIFYSVPSGRIGPCHCSFAVKFVCDKQCLFRRILEQLIGIIHKKCLKVVGTKVSKPSVTEIATEALKLSPQQHIRVVLILLLVVGSKWLSLLLEWVHWLHIFMVNHLWMAESLLRISSHFLSRKFLKCVKVLLGNVPNAGLLNPTLLVWMVNGVHIKCVETFSYFQNCPLKCSTYLCLELIF